MKIDSDMIDRTGEIPEEYVQELRDMGAFGIKIPTEYGGLGLSQMSYIRAMELVTSKDGSVVALLSAPTPFRVFMNEPANVWITRAPWISGMTQGTAIQAYSRAAVRLQNPPYFEIARAALGVFRTPPPEGVRVDTPVGAQYVQYSFAPQLHILNGFVQALNGLFDFASLANDAEGRALFAAGEAQARVEVPTFDTGAWSLYRPGEESDLGYHKLLRDFLRNLCARVSEPAVYCTEADKLTSYLFQPPVLALKSTAARLRWSRGPRRRSGTRR